MPQSAYYALGPVAREMLRHYARGEMYTWLNQTDGERGWIAASHRGVLMMPTLHIGHTVKKCLARKEFEFRYNTAFETVVEHCGDLGREGKTWITAELGAAYLELHRQGFAYSCEAWKNDVLVGGVFGVQIGGFVSIDSMFHVANNAGKAVLGHHAINLQQRGFLFADVNYASEHTRRFGAEWVPQWQFEKMMRPALHSGLSMIEGAAAPMLPWHVLMAEKSLRVIRSVGLRLTRSFSRELQTAGIGGEAIAA